MVFSQPVFLFGFLPLVLGFCHLAPKRFKNYILLLFSLIFYGWGEPRFVFVMIAVSLVNFAAALAMARFAAGRPALRRALLAAAAAANVGLLAYFKYAGFFAANLNTLFGAGLNVPVIELPIGISFFTFQAMSYTADVYRGVCAAQKNPFYVLLYISLFPQLIAGPIVRYSDIESEINERSVSWTDMSAGVERFIIGFAKKVIIADQAAYIADAVFDMGPASPAAAWLGAIAYALQIYYDFSAYSDMAIGLGLMLGFHFLENFNYPYAAVSISDFWRRWHISLSTWFRDYVYIPLGGSRRGAARRTLNLLAVWFLTGLWHGARWNFVLWGLYYFALLSLEKLIPARTLEKIPSILRRLAVLLLVLVGWVFFRADGISAAIDYLRVMFTPAALNNWQYQFAVLFRQGWMYLLLGGALSFPLVKKRLPAPALLAIFGAAVLFMINSTYSPFIYFRF
ncbi:MAG: MBOAT family protein [Oscillospiraceae bacterium]|nr:MBOAT family protein [Oscillospiraceae bacterium]